MTSVHRILIALLPLSCTADDGASTGTDTDVSSSVSTSGSVATAGNTSSGSDTNTSSATSTSPSTATTATTTTSTTTATTTSTATTATTTTTTTTGFMPSVGEGVFLYTGAGGNNYDTDAVALEMLYDAAGIGVTRSDVVTGDLTAEHGCLVLLNPKSDLPPEVHEAAQAMVDGGGRVVFQTEHSGYGGHDIANALLEEMGSSLLSLPESRGGWAMVDLASAPPLTDGISELSPFFVARVDIGSGEAIATLSGEEWVVIARESVSQGEVVIVGDGSMFGYSLSHGDNKQFILNFAAPTL